MFTKQIHGILRDHPRLTAALFTLSVWLSTVGVTIANEGGSGGP